MIPALTTLALLLAPGAPDVIPSGWKAIELELRIELGEGVRGLCFAHQVEKGDTFAKIAKTYLGTTSRWTEIAALNPDVEPTRVPLGQILWIPPREGLLPTESPRFVYVDSGAPVQSYPHPFKQNNTSRGYPPRGRLVLLLVPAGERGAVEKLRGKDPRGKAMTELVDAGRIARIQCEARGRAVREDDPVARRFDTYRIDRHPETGVLSVALRCCEEFDADGVPVLRKTAEDEDERKKEALLLVLLASAGGAGLLLLVRRRRLESVPCPA